MKVKYYTPIGCLSVDNFIIMHFRSESNDRVFEKNPISCPSVQSFSKKNLKTKPSSILTLLLVNHQNTQSNKTPL